MKPASRDRSLRESEDSDRVKDASSRLEDILRTARKMSFTAEDLARLSAVNKLTGRRGGGEGVWLKRGASLLVAAVALMLVCLLVCSVEERGFPCRHNTSQAIKTIPMTRQPIATARGPEETPGDDQSDHRAESPRQQRYLMETPGDDQSEHRAESPRKQR